MKRDDFIRKLEESGLYSTINFMRAAAVNNAEATADDCANELISEGFLTRFQADAIIGWYAR